ncbi:MAG: hypothetical protein BWY60_00647 [Actinobacteria bacterium ADurb.Bin346]|nr:MAG: hypothetical protein BWY60_00647 [Actinobacteria bacterium ADurb.Bin346]
MLLNTVIWTAIIFVTIMTQVLFGTVRLIMMVRGKKALSMIIGFFEAAVALTISITVISNAVKQGINIYHILAYGAGFSLGLLIGIIISEKITKEILSVNIISKKHSDKIEHHLRLKGFGLTCYHGTGKDGEINILNIICKKSDLLKLQAFIQEIDPKALVTSHALEGMKGGFLYDIKSRL